MTLFRGGPERASRLRADGQARDASTRPIGAPNRWAIVAGVVAQFVVFILAMILGLFMGGLVAGLIDPSLDFTESLNPIVVVIQLCAALFAYVVAAYAMERRRSAFELAFRRVGGLLVGLVLGALTFLVCYGAIAVLGGYSFSLNDAPDWNRIGVLTLAAGVGAGITEEIIFRGIGFRLGERIFGTWISILLSSAIFGLVHITNPNATWWGAIAIALEAGLLFALLYAITRSLWLVMGFHMAWNIVQGPVLGVPVSGTGEPAAWGSTQMHGSGWLTGGEFGAEGSVVTVVLLVALSTALIVVLARRGDAVAPLWSSQRDPAALLPARQAHGGHMDGTSIH